MPGRISGHTVKIALAALAATQTMNALFISASTSVARLAYPSGLPLASTPPTYFGLRRQRRPSTRAGKYSPGSSRSHSPSWLACWFAAGPSEHWLAASSLYRVSHLTLVVILGHKRLFRFTGGPGFRSGWFSTPGSRIGGKETRQHKRVSEGQRIPATATPFASPDLAHHVCWAAISIHTWRSDVPPGTSRLPLLLRSRCSQPW